MRLKVLHWQGGDGTSSKKLDGDLDILWVSKGDNVDLSKWSKDGFSAGLTPIANILPASPWRPIILACVLLQKNTCSFTDTFFHLPTEKKFQLPVGACRNKLISDPALNLLEIPAANLIVIDRLESTQSIIIPELVELTNDEETSVRLAGLETITNLLSLLDDGENFNLLWSCKIPYCW